MLLLLPALTDAELRVSEASGVQFRLLEFSLGFRV